VPINPTTVMTVRKLITIILSPDERMSSHNEIKITYIKENPITLKPKSPTKHTRNFQDWTIGKHRRRNFRCERDPIQPKYHRNYDYQKAWIILPKTRDKQRWWPTKTSPQVRRS